MDKNDYLKRLAGGGSSAGTGLSDSRDTGNKSALDRLAGGSFQDALPGRSGRSGGGSGDALSRLAGGAALDLKPRDPSAALRSAQDDRREGRSAQDDTEARAAESIGPYTEGRKASPYQGMSGEEIYAARKTDEEKAKSDFWDEFKRMWVNSAVQAQQAQSGAPVTVDEQLARDREIVSAVAGMREAKERQKEAAKAIDWDGREELVRKLDDLDERLTWSSDLQESQAIEEERRQITEQLRAGDLAAGNGERVYGGIDEARRFTKGTGKSIAGGVVAAGGALGRAYAQGATLNAVDDMQDAYALRGETDEWLKLSEETRKRVKSEEFNAPFEKVLDTAQRISDDAAKELRAVKEGKSVLGQAAVDIAENVVEMGFDAGAGLITGGGSLASMFVRVMGSGVLEARADGADTDEQLLYGIAKGGIEVLTEKLADGVAGIYGKGAADEITKNLVRRLTENRPGRALLLALAGAVEEGGEEVLSDLLSPLAEKIYKDESLKELYGQIEPSEVLYDFLIGAAIGGFGSVTSAVSGKTAEDLGEMDLRDALEYGSMDYTADSAMDALSGRYSPEELQARDEAAKARSERAWERLGLGETADDNTEEQTARRKTDLSTPLRSAQDDGKKGRSDQNDSGARTAAGVGPYNESAREPVYVKESLTPEVQTEKGAGRILAPTKDGKLLVQLENGSTVTMTPDEANMPSAARTLLDSVQELGESAAEAYANYPADASIDVDGYVAAWKAAEELGEMGLKPESVDMLKATNVLPEDARRTAYRLGAEKRGKRIAAAETGETSIPTAAEGVGPYEGERARTQENQTQAQRSGLRLERTSSEANELSSQPRKRGDAELARTRGSVSFDGGTVGGVSYKAVSGETAQHLSRRQEAAVNAAYAIAEITGFDFVFYEGETGAEAKGVYQQGGKIWLNIKAGKTLGKELIACTMSHEITHALQEYAPEQYDALRRFIAGTLMDKGQFDALVTARRKAEPGLSYTETVDEVVANGCETMLRDSEAIKELARQNRTLAERIRDFIDSFIKDLRAAFGDGMPESPEAQALVAEVETIRKLWDDALRTAVENRRTGKKNTATNGGVKYAKWTQQEIDTIQNIGQKSVNDFNSTDIKAVEELARQYFHEMGTKSPFFRTWFGDWRQYDTAPVSVANVQNQARGVQHNEDTGWDINVSRMVFNETNEHSDSYVKEARRYLPFINDIVKKAILLDSSGVGKRKSINSVMMHTLYSVVDNGKGPEVIKLYVEEMNDPNSGRTGKRAYQLHNIEKYQPQQKGSQNTANLISASAGSIKTVSDLVSYVKSKDAFFQPKIVNPVLLNSDGTPKVFYHGTPERFTAFSPEEIAPQEGSFFFAENREDAESYGEYVMEVYLTGKKLADYDNMPSEFYSLNSKREQVEWLKQRGYDGWYSEMDGGGWGEVSVFSNTQIKSATDNIGTFDSNNPDIRYSVSDSVSDRALLLEAAEREGAGASEELRRFARRMEDLRGLQRRLERQEKKLEGMKAAEEQTAREIDAEVEITKAELLGENGLPRPRSGLAMTEPGEEQQAAEGTPPHQSAARTASPQGEAQSAERAELEKRIAETREAIAKTEARLDQLERGAKLQREVKALRERWFSQNAAEAVQVQTEIQRENRELREALDFYKQQAKLTTTEQRRVRPEDVTRFTRALLKEHGSEADLDTVRRKLQAIGDWLVRGEDLDGREYRSMARETARLIADETYVKAEDETLYRELSERVRSTRLQASDELKGDIPDYNAWRKSNLGRLTLAKDGLPIDTFYQKLGETYGEGLFPQDITAHSDQIQRIIDVLEEQRPKPMYAYTQGERAAVIQSITDEIMDVMLSGEIRESETMADRNYRRMQDITRQAQEQAREAKNTLEEERAYRKELVREKTAMIRRELKDSAEARQRRASIEKLKNNLARKLQENSGKRHVPENLKRTLGAWLSTINTLSGFASEARVRDYLEATDELRQIAAKGQDVDFGEELDLPEDMADKLQEHINKAREAMKTKGGNTYRMSLEELRTLEDALNAVTHAITNANILLADAGHGRELDATARSSMEHMDAMRKLNEVRGWRRLARQFMLWDNTTPFYAFKRFGKGGEAIYKNIVQGWSKMAMNARQVLDFSESLYTSDYAKKAEKDVYEFELYRRVGGAEEEKRIATGDKAALAMTETEEAGKEGSYNSIGDGEIRGDRETVRVTRAQLMSLYGLLKRQQALGHVLGAGIRVADFKDEKGKLVPQAENYILYEQDIVEMVGKLSDRDKEIVDKMIRYMSTVGSEWGNRVTMKRWGIRAFTEESYFPIKTDQNNFDARTPEGQRASLYRLLNMSFTKNTVKNAKNAIILESVFDVFADHMADMAKYEALALPIVDAMRWYNYREISGEEESGRYTTDAMQKSMEQAYGKEAGKYVLNFLQDLNGSQEGGRGEGTLKALMSNYKVAAVSANLRVMIQQPTSIARAAMVIDPKYLVRGAAMKGGIREALKNSGLAVWKDLGYFDTNINRGIRTQIKHEDTGRDRINDLAMKGAEWGDKATWGAIWNACKIEQAERLGIRIATGGETALAMTEEYEKLMEATAERFDEVIVSTQVMDSTITRSQAMRSTSMIMSQLAAFKSEPTLTYNTLLDAYSDYMMDRRKNEPAALKKHAKRIGRTALVWAFGQALTGLAAALIDVARDDDDYETWLQKLQEHFLKNTLDNMDPTGYLPVINQIADILRGNTQKLMVFEGFEKLVTAAKVANEKLGLEYGWVKEPTSLTYNGKMSTWGAVYKCLQGVSFATGLPLAGASRDAVAIANVFLPMFGHKTVKTYDAGPKNEIKYAWQDGWLTDEEAARYLVEEKVAKDQAAAEKILYQWGLDGTGVYDAVKKAALADDKAAFEKAMAELEAGHYERESVQNAVRSAIKEAYQPDADGRQRFDKQMAIRLMQSYGGLSADKARAQVQEWTCLVVTGIKYDDIDEAYKNGDITLARAKELRMTYGGYSAEQAEATATKWRWQKEHPEYEEISESAAVKYYSIAEPAKISPDAWYEFWKETKGSKKEEAVAFIHRMPLTAAQKDALYRAAGYGEKGLKDTPWHTGS